MASLDLKTNLCPFLSNSDVLQSKNVKPLKIRNFEAKSESFDMLHRNSFNQQKTGCTEEACKGSVVFVNVAANSLRETQDVLDHAKDFMNQYFKSLNAFDSADHIARWNQVEKDIEETGTYQLTSEELFFGAKTAWRNAARCIGRIQWNKLKFFDCRHVTTAKEMFDAICNQIDYTQNGGNVRSAITIFPQRTSLSTEFRIWNKLLISYACYEEPDGSFRGDPQNLEITKVCLKLGWKSPRTNFDILPMVLSANGNDPELFEYPKNFIFEVPLSHPKFDWFEKMNLRWYGIPGVSNMQLDCGGLIFPGCSFTAWYTSFEIGCRMLCEKNRLNLLKPIGVKMGLNTRNVSSLWKDQVLVEVNIAVLHSYHKAKITIFDHHTVADSFMKHLDNEMKLRRGCPADWVWIVPPISSSLMQIFHQEMLNYRLWPSYELQLTPMKTHPWNRKGQITGGKVHHMMTIARAVFFANVLYQKALSTRVKATILYATETGKSQYFAEQLVKLLNFLFDAKIYNISDYDFNSLENETLLLCVVSTTGNGDPPENAISFFNHLEALKKKNQDFSGDFGCNLKYSVFALGSSAYPNFCKFGITLDKFLNDLGGDRLMEVALGDDMSDQEQDFNKWAENIFKNSCDKFGLDFSHVPQRFLSLENLILTDKNTRLVSVRESFQDSLEEILSTFHSRNVYSGRVKSKPLSLIEDAESNCVLLEICIDENELKYEPGDHVAIYPINDPELVNGLLEMFKDIKDPDESLRLQILHEVETESSGVITTWQNHKKIPTTSVRQLLSRLLNITTPPSKQFLSFLAAYCSNEEEKIQMESLSTDNDSYESWKARKLPHLLAVLNEFPSCRPPTAVLLSKLTPLQPRFYSISSSQRKHPGEVHLTVGVVKYLSSDGQQRSGVCSTYIEKLNANDEVLLYFRSAHNFHVSTTDTASPIILVGPGTGIAPFRSFWQEFATLKYLNPSIEIPQILLFTGNRTKNHEIHKDEKLDMLTKQILHGNYSALSREPGQKKTYVQDLLLNNSNEIYQLLKFKNAHIYVCGDVRMAEEVHETFRKIISTHGKIDETSAEKFMQHLKEQTRYHEDSFGVIHRSG